MQRRKPITRKQKEILETPEESHIEKESQELVGEWLRDQEKEEIVETLSDKDSEIIEESDNLGNSKSVRHMMLDWQRCLDYLAEETSALIYEKHFKEHKDASLWECITI